MKHALSNDDVLQRAVLAELHAAGVPAGGVGITMHAGIVTLLGYVEHAQQKQAAENAALWVEGVRAVVVAIEIRAPGTARLRDDQIASEVLMRLAWDAWVPHNALKVAVEQGWVTLVGQVDREEQKAAALEDVRRLFGVAGVSDHTIVKGGSKRVKKPNGPKEAKVLAGGKSGRLNQGSTDDTGH